MRLRSDELDEIRRRNCLINLSLANVGFQLFEELTPVLITQLYFLVSLLDLSFEALHLFKVAHSLKIDVQGVFFCRLAT